MIEVNKLTKRYGARVAVSELDFAVGKGEVVGFLGPNGAGKTTTLRILAGFLGPTSGSVRVAGFDVVEEPQRARAQLGYMPETSPSYPELRVMEYLSFRAELKGVARRRRGAAVEHALTLASLSERAGSLIGQLSKGYRQRLGLADALVADPPLLILDEPTSGLDPNQIRDVRRVIRGLAEQHTVLVSTHILAEVEATCDRAIVIHQGKLVAEGSIDALRARTAAREGTLVVRRRLDVTTDDGKSLNNPTKKYEPSQLALIDDVLEVSLVEGVYYKLRVRLPHGRSSLEAWIGKLASDGWIVAEATLGGGSLEQVFAELTRQVGFQQVRERGAMPPRFGATMSAGTRSRSRTTEEPASVGSSDEPASVGSSDEPVSVGRSDEPASVGSSDEPASVGRSDEPVSAGSSDEPVSVGSHDETSAGDEATAAPPTPGSSGTDPTSERPQQWALVSGARPLDPSGHATGADAAQGPSGRGPEEPLAPAPEGGQDQGGFAPDATATDVPSADPARDAPARDGAPSDDAPEPRGGGS